MRRRLHRSRIEAFLRRADVEVSPTSLPDILVPKVCVRGDKFAHETSAFRIVENHDADPMLAEQVFGSQEVLVFSNHDAGNAEQQRRPRAHDAGTESADQRQFSPIASPAGIAQADRFGVSGWIAALHSQVMSPSYDLALPVRQYRTDRQTPFAQTLSRLGESFL